jgi:drug/metabolite transporter (DMT)-like permease
MIILQAMNKVSSLFIYLWYVTIATLIIYIHSSSLVMISNKAKISLFIAMFLWASAFVGIRAGLQSYSPGSLALLRFIVASIAIFLIFLRLQKRSVITFNEILRLLIIGATTRGIYHITLNYGELTVSSGIASFIISLSPIITAAFAFVFLRERLNKYGVMGMAISFLGVLLILLAEEGELKLNMGVLYVLTAAFAGSIYSILQKPYLKKYHAIEVTAFMMWGATLALLYYLPQLTQEILHASWTASLSVVYLGIFPAAIAYLCWNYALAEMPASQAVNFLYFMPLIATLLGWLLLGEIPVILSLIGGLIALAGVWVVNESQRVKKKNNNQSIT